MSSSDEDFSRTSYVVDATKPQREYAFYRDIGKTVLVCELVPSAAHMTICKSRKEFNVFVAKYMDLTN